MGIRTGLVATGSTQGTALPLAATYSVFATVAASTGCILQNDRTDVYIRNGGANNLAVYPPVGYSIDGGSVNASVAISAGTTARYVQDPATGNWFRFDK
jgi:hypothetical protein